MPTVNSIHAIEILDSRGNPTIRTFVTSDTGETASSSVPSGASTGTYEAYELRDGDPKRYHGQGVRKAVENVNTVIAKAIVGMDLADPKVIDEKMLSLDGTGNKSNLGANALLSISQAVLKSAALVQKKPLWQVIHDYYFSDAIAAFPRIMVNVVNGGVHADWNFDIQEFMIIPKTEIPSIAIPTASEIFLGLKNALTEKNLSTLVGYEGGFSPELSSDDEVFEMILTAARNVGYENNQHFVFGLDCAASEWCTEGKYLLHKENKTLTADELMHYYLQLKDRYHIFSFEDPFSEDDFDAFAHFTEHATDFQVVGDDLYVTNAKRLTEGIDHHATNAIVIKPNQVGTIMETVETMQIARKAQLKIVVAHRSGETEDSFIADFAYGSGADFLKAGSMSRSERLAKYNRLLEIEQKL